MLDELDVDFAVLLLVCAAIVFWIASEGPDR
jgi:hypothetical protein